MLLQQFKNPANPEIHFKTTGPEIWNDTKGNVDVLVAGIGTGGTITGISRYFKLEKKKKILSVGVEPESSPVITQTLAGDPVRPGPPGFRASARDSFRTRWISRWSIAWNWPATKNRSRWRGAWRERKGFSPASPAERPWWRPSRIAREPEMKGKTFVVILPDSGERYLTSMLFDGFTE